MNNIRNKIPKFAAKNFLFLKRIMTAKFKILFFILATFQFAVSTSQTTTQPVKKDSTKGTTQSSETVVAPAPKLIINPFETNGSIESRFKYLTDISSNYSEFKLIPRYNFESLHLLVRDSIRILRKSAISNAKLVESQTIEITDLKRILDSHQKELETAYQSKDTISVMGLEINKELYNTVVLILLVFLLITTLYYMYQHKNSFEVTKNAQEALTETQNEYENYQRKMLEKQQEISRRLQDEINKNKKE